MASADRIESIVPIVRGQTDEARVVVVVSAAGGVTDMLVRAAAMAAEGDGAYADVLEGIVDRHVALAGALVEVGEKSSVGTVLDAWWTELEELLHGVFLLKECTPRTCDRIMSFGELASATLVAATLRREGVAAEARDARSLLVTDGSFGAGRIDVDTTRERVRDGISATGPLQVVTGFIAATSEGETTTLGRSGSDYTAALLGAMLAADRIEIWTDVSGVMSADPRMVEDAFPLASLTYEELMELSHFGARVVHTPSIHPARAAGVPLVIRNTFDPAFGGTRIAPEGPAEEQRAVRGIASIHDIALLRLEGDGMMGVPGVAQRLFGALARRDISVILITQASSEHSICFAVEPARMAAARECVDEEFDLERRVGIVDDLVVEEGLSIVAVVGAGMRHTPGIAGRLFSVLGRVGVNVHAIAQGSSELNISVVVSSEDERRTLRALHGAFFGRRGSAPASVWLAGVGQVGSALLELIGERAVRLDEVGDVEMCVVGVADSRRSALEPGGLAVGDWRSILAASARPSTALAADAVAAGAVAAGAMTGEAVGEALAADAMTAGANAAGATTGEVLREALTNEALALRAMTDEAGVAGALSGEAEAAGATPGEALANEALAADAMTDEASGGTLAAEAMTAGAMTSETRAREAVAAGAITDEAGWRGAITDEAMATAPIAEVGGSAGSAGTPPTARSGWRRGVYVDCTASETVAERYVELLRAGVCVVSANKRAFSGSLDAWAALMAAAGSGARLAFETTVGAALPILRTIADLVATGDEVVSIEGVLSGSLGFVFDGVMEGRSLSQVVADARTAGYTEPDPREDLGGADVARKLLIAGRVAGLSLEPDQIDVRSVLPDRSWLEGSVDGFMARLAELDADVAERRAGALAAGRRLCYLGSVDRDGGTVGITEIGGEHPCWSLRGTDNLIAISTRRCASPVVVRGPGAGPVVTAGGVLADILRVIDGEATMSW